MSGLVRGVAVKALLLCVVFFVSGCERQSDWWFGSNNKKLSAQPVGNFVTVLKAEGKSEAVFIASVDTDKGIIKVKNLKGKPKSGKSYDLWAIGAAYKAPLSLGVVDNSVDIPVKKLGGTNPDFLKKVSFAISVEPYGGSRTGKPTGPVLYTGQVKPSQQTRS